MSPNAGGGGGVRVSAIEYSCARGAQINFGDLTPYLTYAWPTVFPVIHRVAPNKLVDNMKNSRP
jgi:hypothetical protein